jgi:hypothetical protein
VKKFSGKCQNQYDGKGQHKYDDAFRLPPSPLASEPPWPKILTAHPGYKISGDKHCGQNDEVVEHGL